MSYNNEDINSVVSDSLESEIIALNSSLKNNIINSSFETNNESDLYNLPTFVQFGQNLSVDQIEYFFEIQEYPKTSSTGVAKPFDQKCPFLGLSICKTYHSCLGVKVCEYSSPELDIEHTFVDFESQLYKKIFDTNESSINTITLNTFGQAYNTPCLYIDPVTNIQYNGKPVLREYKKIDNTISTIRKFIGCKNYKLEQKGHYYISINQNVNLNYLEQLFQNYIYCPNEINREDQNEIIDKCFTVLPNSSVRNYCSFLHKTNTQIGKGKIINKGNCPVKFYHILPDNLTECLFIVMISTGVHNHLPPPPNIMENLQKIINNEYDLDLTACKLLTRPMVKMYLQGKPLSSIHTSLNNQSRLNYLIEKISDLNIHLDKILLQKNLPDSYIRMARFFDNGQYLVLCTQKEQTKFFAQSLYAEIDMAFKRIHGATNEWEICAYVNCYQKTLVIARAFTNIQSAQHLFEDLFTIIENDTQKPFKFQHIHGSGLGCLFADEHQGQALGLGQYLHSKYNNLSCEEHLQHIYKLCQIHFNHNNRNKAISNETKTLMYSIPTLKTQENVIKALTNIKESGELGAAEWVQDKSKPWILAGLSVAFTKMNIHIWNQTPNNTNANESAHANINRDGCDFDQWQWNTAKTYEQYNVKDSYNDKSELARLTHNAKKSQLFIAIPTIQEQHDYTEWKDKKLKLQQKKLGIIKRRNCAS
ncbi:hypothetical protein C2G38_2210110 [Gigaspora rosea]|uniref:Uncharacterized protein n=1 Tax=Gigaspora rosea TaxID=44941 RepID=A0A397UHC1_9GLOM|nr:hypothetical protein C2G38_2210110 [Gigaspora rosea]